MFRNQWHYAGLSPALESAIMEGGGCSLQCARAFAARLRRAARGTAANHWPSPFLIPGMEPFAKAFLGSLQSQEHFPITIEGPEAAFRITSSILQLAHDRLVLKQGRVRPGPVSFQAQGETLQAEGDIPAALFALQTGIALRLASHPWFNRTLAVLDFETTGFSISDSRITEYGLVLVRNEIIISTHGSLINPGIPIPKEITQLTGIDDAMVADAPGEERASDELAALLAKADMIGGHNYTDFDSRFLESMFTRSARTTPSLPVFDTLQLARKYIQGQANNKQPTLLSWLGWPGKVFHRAVDDALGCAFILRVALRNASAVQALIEEALPLVFLAQATSGPEILQAGSEALAEKITGLFPDLPQAKLLSNQGGRETEFCTRIFFDSPHCGDEIRELGQTIQDSRLDALTFLLENLPASAATRTVLPEEGLMLDLPGLGLIISVPENIWNNERIRPDARYDLIIRLEEQPAAGVPAGRLLDMRLNPLSLQS